MLSLVEYFLANFPKGYMLYSDEIKDNHVVHRYDPYLYSMCPLLSVLYLFLTSFPKGDKHKFRSPAEFVPHAAWLIAGMPPGRCKCRYCSPGRIPQGKINKELNASFKEAIANEEKKRVQAAKNQSGYTPRRLPLEEVFLKPVPTPG